jgi:hypothetical protein
MKWAAKQEKPQPLETCFFLTSTFIELTRIYPASSRGGWLLNYRSFSGGGVACRLCPRVFQHPEQDHEST